MSAAASGACCIRAPIVSWVAAVSAFDCRSGEICAPAPFFRFVDGRCQERWIVGEALEQTQLRSQGKDRYSAARLRLLEVLEHLRTDKSLWSSSGVFRESSTSTVTASLGLTRGMLVKTFGGRSGRCGLPAAAALRCAPQSR